MQLLRRTVVAVLLLGLFRCYVLCRRVVNNVDKEEVAFTSFKPDTMEAILEMPEFRNKKPSLTKADETVVWAEALSEYDKVLRRRRKPEKVSDNYSDLPFSQAPQNPASVISSHKRQIAAKNESTTVKPKRYTSIILKKHDDKLGSNDKNKVQSRTYRMHESCIGNSNGAKEGDTMRGGETLTTSDRVLKKMEMFQAQVYGACGKSYPTGTVCFGVPDGCVEKRECRLVVSFGNNENNPGFLSVNFAGETTDTGFIAFAFSHDRFIGEDIIIYCINGLHMEFVGLYQAFITKNKRPITQKSKHYYQRNFCPRFGHQQREMMGCSFDIAIKIYLDDGSYTNIHVTPLHIMLSFGHFVETVSLNGSHYGSLKSQHLAEFSSDPIILADALHNPKIIYSRSRVLFHLHAISAVIAFIFLIPSGIFFAKYGREVQAYNTVICGRWNIPAWLRIHLFMAISSVTLIIVALITIMVELDFTWRSTSTIPLTHSVSGSIACVMVLVNFVGGYWFDSTLYSEESNIEEKLSPKKHCWCHWLVGNLAYLCGVICICITPHLPTSQVPCFVEYFGYLHFAIFLCAHVIMSFDTKRLMEYLDDHKNYYQRVILGPMISWRKQDIPKNEDEESNLDVWKARRRVLLFIFLVSFLCAFTISVLLLLPVVLCR